MSRAASSPPELPGYTSVKLLGSGGFADVFLYEQHLPRRRVAVKVLLADGLTAASRAAFVAEANVMAQLSSHPYIVTIHHAGVAGDDRPYLVMEYAPGASLAERYKKAPLTVEDALRTGVRLSSAVATAHSAGILHRDIKPGNVLTNEFGWPALTDFGIASVVDEGAVPLHTTTRGGLEGSTGGTGSTESQSIGLSVPWSPPEMFEDDPQPDVRSDVFSLAATVYTLLAGQTPFEVRGRPNGTVDLMGRIERGAITPLARDDVPLSFVAVLRKGMEVDRAHRFATAVEFARALQRVELELGFAPTAIDVPNLAVDEGVRGAPDDADATRARGVATIDAQPAAPAPSTDATRLRGPAATVSPDAPAVDRTVMRARPAVDTAPPPVETASAPPAPAATPEPRRRGGTIAAAILIPIVAVLAVVGIVAAVVSGQNAPDPVGPDPADGGDDDALIGGQVQAPVVRVAAGESASEVVVTADNPDYVEGDKFRWYFTGSTGTQRVVADEEDADLAPERAVFTVDVPPDTLVCIAVSVQRSDSRLSPATEDCFP
jgi:hypothetical protein